MRNLLSSSLLFWSLIASPHASSAWSSTITLTSDYLFNGITQTQSNAALQASLDWSATNGVYAGAWGSNVDFGDDTSTELDIYLGYSFDLVSKMNIDLGIAQYTYHGASYSSSGDYQEAYLKWTKGSVGLNFWYSWDYFGTGARHYVVMANYFWQLNEQFTLLASIDNSVSLDDDEYTWQDNDANYTHGQLSLNFSYQKFDVALGVHQTDRDNYSDFAFVVSISRALEF